MATFLEEDLVLNVQLTVTLRTLLMPDVDVILALNLKME